jgi:hypothetical protein
MLRDGNYVAWFRTPRGQGTGLVRLAEGKISGGDTVITYGGSYEVDGDQFRATLTTKRHAAGQPSVFGVDEVELKLVGRCRGAIATCSGTLDAVPGMTFEATLILSRDQSLVSGVSRAPSKFDASKLPRLPGHRLR